MINHSGSARDPLLSEGDTDGQRRRRSPTAPWIMAAVGVVAVGAALIATGGSLLPSDSGSRVAGAFSSRG